MFMDVSCKEEGDWFGKPGVTSLFYADDVVLLAPSACTGQFTAVCEAAEMAVSISK